MRNRLSRFPRPHGRQLFAPALAALLLIAGTGCATRGPNHIYATLASSPAIHDLTAGTAISRLVAPTERVTGLAYDFNTDHLFLRVVPAQVIRVIERPSGKILRQMPLPAELRAAASADLAIRSADRHLFAVHADRRSVVELTLYGEPLRTIQLAGLDMSEAVNGLAYDQNRDRLLALVGATVRGYDLAGAEVNRTTLAVPVAAVSLGYDSDASRYFVALESAGKLGEFDSAGQLIKTHPAPNALPFTAIDAGRRALVRVF